MSRSMQDWYLATLGIVKYVSRDAPPHVPETVTVKADPVEPLVRVSKIIPIETAKKPSPEPVEQTDEVAIVPAAKFSFVAWHPVDDLLVINDLGEAKAADKDQVQLLANILKAIKRLPENGTLPEMELLGWPQQSEDTSEEGALTLLSTFLAARIKKRGVCWVLLMGQGIVRYIDGADAEGVQKLQMPGGATGLVVPSLSEMLQQPQLKKSTWQIIRPLSEET